MTRLDVDRQELLKRVGEFAAKSGYFEALLPLKQLWWTFRDEGSSFLVGGMISCGGTYIAK